MEAIERNSDYNQRTSQQKILQLTSAGCLGLCYMNEILNRSHRDAGANAKNKSTNQNHCTAQINFEKRRHKRQRKFEIHQNRCDCCKHGCVSDFHGFCHFG